MPIPTFGPNAVDWETRVDMDRLRDERLARLRAELDRSRARRSARLRLHQHPVHDLHPHRHLGDRQDDPVRAPGPRRRTDRVGLRLGRQTPPALQPVAGLLAVRTRTATRTRPTTAPTRATPAAPVPESLPCAAPSTPVPVWARPSPRRSSGSSNSTVCTRTARRGRDRAAGAGRAAGRRYHGGRRPTGLPGGTPHQDRRRDQAAHARLLDGRRRLRRALPVPASRGAGERVRRSRRQDPLRSGLGVRRGC